MRSQAAKELRSSSKYWNKLREDMQTGRLSREGSGASLLAALDVPGRLSQGNQEPPEHQTSSFFEQHFNVGSGAGFRHSPSRRRPTASTGGRLPSTSGSTGSHENGRSRLPNAWWSPRTDATAIWNLVTSSWINLLLIIFPLALLAERLHWGSVAVFMLSFAGIIPLALVIGDVTEDLALRCGDIVGGLVNATFGNIVELIISMVALSKKSESMNQVAGMSNLGSILSNLLLVLGCCFLFGGLKHKQQKFSALANQVCNSLLFLAVIAIVLPLTAKHFPDMAISEQDLLHFSRVTAVVLTLAYVAYLYFQIISHNDIFAGVGEEEDAEEPALTVTAELLLLLGISLVVAAASELITGSIEDMSKSSGLTQNFLSIILLPVAGNAVEHITAVMMAMRNKMDLALGIAIGSSIQIAIFVLPTCVLASWAMSNPFTLVFNSLGTVAIVLATIHANFITQGGTSHWLMGLQLICTYILIAGSFLYT